MPNESKSIKLLGIKISDLPKQEIIKTVSLFLDAKDPKQIVTVNPEFILEANSDPEFAQVLNSAELSVADGFGLVLMGRLKGLKLNRVAGADLVPEILSSAEEKGLKLAVVNWDEGLSSDEDIIAAVRAGWPKLELAVFQCKRDMELPPAYFDYDPQVTLIALGAPWQDKLGADLKRRSGSLRLVMGVGGSFDFLTDRVKRAPTFWRSLGLEWLWRLSIQPKKRFKRIFKAVVVFPLYFLRRELLSRQKSSK